MKPNLKLKILPLLVLSACGGGAPDHVLTSTVGDTPVQCETFLTPNSSPNTATTNCISPTLPFQPTVQPALPPGVTAPIPPQVPTTPAKVVNAPTTAPTASPTAPTMATPVLVVSAPSVSYSQRATSDRTDEQSKQQIHVIYLLAKGAVDRNLDRVGSIQNYTDAMNSWLTDRTSQKFNFDRYQSYVDVTTIALLNEDSWYDSQPNQFKRDAIENELLTRGFVNSANKRYLVFYEGYNPDGNCGDSRNVTSILYLLAADGRCATELVAIHELLHNFGAVHSSVPNDIMYSGPLNRSTSYTITASELKGAYLEQ